MQTTKKIGCDPELFLFDKVLDRIVPACGLVEGSKESPIMLINGGMVQLDGTVLEFGTPPVDAEGTNFSSALRQTLDIIRKQLFDKHGDRYELRCGASAAYSPQDITQNHEGLLVGFSPQYIMMREQAPVRGILQSVEKLPLNNVPIGGHIHFGFVDSMLSEKVQDYSAMRYISVLKRSELHRYLSDVNCSSVRRRNDVMGFPEGTPTIRVKPYGIEFRNLSSYWLACHSVADLFSDLHSATVNACVGGRFDSHAAGQTSREIRKNLNKIAKRVSMLDAKFQQTLPLAY